MCSWDWRSLGTVCKFADPRQYDPHAPSYTDFGFSCASFYLLRHFSTSRCSAFCLNSSMMGNSLSYLRQNH